MHWISTYLSVTVQYVSVFAIGVRSHGDQWESLTVTVNKTYGNTLISNNMCTKPMEMH